MLLALKDKGGGGATGVGGGGGSEWSIEEEGSRRGPH